VHVFRDIHASFVNELKLADLQFSLTKPRTKSGKLVMVATNEGTSFQFLLTQFNQSAPEVVIFDSQADIPFDAAIRGQLAKPELVCGPHPSFIPTSISGEEREAAEMYVRFLLSHCGASVTKPATAANTQPVANGDKGQEDPHRPPCTSARCRKIRAFIKSHYCGERLFGNGPEESCDLRGLKKPAETGTEVTAEYFCSWDESAKASKCKQRGQPTSQERDIVLQQMRLVGLPKGGEHEVHFKVLRSSGLSVMQGVYDHLNGLELTFCEVVVVADANGGVHMLRKVKLRKAENVDVVDFTTWSPVDIADADGDGRLEVVLEGDAYEDHWIEVVSLQNGAFRTVFSGLGYYL